MNRRELLRNALLVSAAAGGPAWALVNFPNLARERSPKLIGLWTDQRFYQDHKSFIAGSVPGEVRSLDLRSGEVISIAAGCFGHSCSQNLREPSMIATTSKWNRFGAVVDFRQRKLVTRLVAPKGHSFYGHSAFSQEGLLYASVVEDIGKLGSLAEIDPKSGEILRQLPAGGRGTHEFFFPEPGVAVVANAFSLSGVGGSISWISIKDGKILKCEELPAAGHIKALASQEVAIGYRYNQPRSGLFIFNANSGKLRRISDASGYDEKMFEQAEFLSFCEIRDGVIASSSEGAKQIVIWDYHQNLMFALPNPASTLGLVRHQNSLWSTLADGTVFRHEMISSSPFVNSGVLVSSHFSRGSHTLLADLERVG